MCVCVLDNARVQGSQIFWVLKPGTLVIRISVMRIVNVVTISRITAVIHSATIDSTLMMATVLMT